MRRQLLHAPVHLHLHVVDDVSVVDGNVAEEMEKASMNSPEKK